MFGIQAQRGRRDGRAASGAPGPQLAAGVLTSLLLLAALVPAAAQGGTGDAAARAHTATAARLPPGAPGSASAADATKLENVITYRGSVAPEGQLWYKLLAGGERIYVEVLGETPSCSVRATLLDASGRPLGQIVSASNETLPLVVYFPTHPLSQSYYLRIDANPYAPCASADYAFRLVEPEQPEEVKCPPAPATNGEPQTCVAASKERAAPAFTSRACFTYQAAFDRANRAVARMRALVAHHRASLRTLRHLEGVERVYHRRANVYCNT